MTPGYKTTEFWLTVLAMVASALLGSGAFLPESATAKAIGLIVTVLAALGYTASRTLVKTTTAKAGALTAPAVSQAPPP